MEFTTILNAGSLWLPDLLQRIFLVEGYNKIRFLHLVTSESIKSWEIYFDDDENIPTFYGVPQVIENSPILAWLSGIKYYGLGSTFNISYVGVNCFRKTYHTTQVSYYSMPGFNTVTKNPSSVPLYIDNFSISDTGVVLNVSGVMNVNARLTAGLRDPYGNNPTSQSAPENRLVHTYGVVNDAKHEYFRDEYYRRP
jgi:hypothetical protein